MFMRLNLVSALLFSTTLFLGSATAGAQAAAAAQAPPPSSNPQQPSPSRNPNDSLKSVEVGADDRVTVRIYAPKASAVTVSGDFLMGAPPAALAKNDEGVWSYTSSVLPPDSYTYNFTVDGVVVMDTKSLTFRENPNALFNYFDMPGPETDFMALKNVPHGRVEWVAYHSSVLNAERRMHVYLPPHYETLPEVKQHSMPVLYLLHGFGDNDISWTSAGKINLVLDNLYAEGKLKNFIVVMPSGHTVWPPQGRRAFNVGVESDPFTQEFLHDIVPFVKETYPVSERREDTAIAGFSMGGAQTLNLALWDPQMFAYVYAISTGYFPEGLKELDEKHAAVLQNVAGHPFRQFVFARGKDDSLMRVNSTATMKEMDKAGVHYRYVEMNGAHSFVFSRRFLASAFPEMFR